MKNTRMVQVLVAASLVLFSWGARADSDFPQRPIRIIVPSTAGSAPDILVRMLSEPLSQRLKQPVVVENKAGAGGILAAETVAKAAPDGYTLLVAHDGTMAINTVMYKSLPYNPVKDFTPIAPLAVNEFVLIAHPSTGVRTFADFTAFVRKAEGKASYASAGVGTPNHVFMELILQGLQAPMVHVPYRGGAPAVADVVGGQVQFMLAGMAPALPHIQARKIQAVAVVQSKRSGVLPDVPTIGEGWNGFAQKTWFGLFAPAKTPSDVTGRLHAVLLDILARQDIRERLSAQGMVVDTGSAQSLGDLVVQDIRKYEQLAQKVKLEAN